MGKPVENPNSSKNLEKDRGCTFCCRPIRVQASNCEHPMCRFCYVLNGNQCSPCAERKRFKIINEETICCLPLCTFELIRSMRPHFTCGHKYCYCCSTKQYHKKCPNCGDGRRIIRIEKQAKLKITMGFKPNTPKRRGRPPLKKQIPILEKVVIAKIELKEHEDQVHSITEDTSLEQKGAVEDSLSREQHHCLEIENTPESSAVNTIGNSSHHSNPQSPHTSVSSTTTDVSSTVKRTDENSPNYAAIVNARQSKYEYLCLSPRRRLKRRKSDANQPRLEYTLRLQFKDSSNKKNWRCKIVPRKCMNPKSSEQTDLQQHASSSSGEEQQTEQDQQIHTITSETATQLSDCYDNTNEIPVLECYANEVLHSISSTNDSNVEQSRHVSSSDWLSSPKECSSEGEINENKGCYTEETTTSDETKSHVAQSNLLTNQEITETALLKEKIDAMYLPLMSAKQYGGSHPLAKTMMFIKVGENYFPDMISEHFLGKDANSGEDTWGTIALHVCDALAKQFSQDKIFERDFNKVEYNEAQKNIMHETLKTNIVEELQCETSNTDQNDPVDNVIIEDCNNENINLSPHNLPGASVNISGRIKRTKPNSTTKMYIKVEIGGACENSHQVIVKSAEAIEITYPENAVADDGKVLFHYISTEPNQIVKTTENVHYINMSESCYVEMAHGGDLRKAMEEWIANSSPVEGSPLGPNINITNKDGNVIAEVGCTAETFIPILDLVRRVSNLNYSAPGDYICFSNHISKPTIITIYRDDPYCSDPNGIPLDAPPPVFKQIILPAFFLGTPDEHAKMAKINQPIPTNLNMLADVALLHSKHTVSGNGFDSNITSSMEMVNTEMEVSVNDFGAEVTIPYLVE